MPKPERVGNSRDGRTTSLSRAGDSPLQSHPWPGTAHFCFLPVPSPASSCCGPPRTTRLLPLPRRIASCQRATLAVLDVNGRLTPGVVVNFSNGDRVTTDVTGRAL